MHIPGLGSVFSTALYTVLSVISVCFCLLVEVFTVALWFILIFRRVSSYSSLLLLETCLLLSHDILLFKKLLYQVSTLKSYCEFS